MDLFDFGHKEKKKIISPIEFVGDNYKEEAISWIEKDINTESNFAILRTTANGKFIRGNLLYYKLNGVEVYTDINNIIFVDTINNTLFIKEYSKVANQIDPENPEEKQYIILFTDLGYDEVEEGTPLRWETSQGRLSTYELIKSNIAVIDIDKSLVLVETLPLKDSLTVREFVNYLKNANYVEDDLDIDMYIGSNYI